jgi:urease subunit alpha
MAVRNTRSIGKRDVVRKSRTPNIEVDSETFAVTVDGVHTTVQPLTTVSLNTRCWPRYCP